MLGSMLGSMLELVHPFKPSRLGEHVRGDKLFTKLPACWPSLPFFTLPPSLPRLVGPNATFRHPNDILVLAISDILSRSVLGNAYCNVFADLAGQLPRQSRACIGLSNKALRVRHGVCDVVGGVHQRRHMERVARLAYISSR